MRDSFIFYRSFYEAAKNLPKETQADVYRAVMAYALDGETVGDLCPITTAIFLLIKPQIDANTKRFLNGKTGGRPKAENNQEQTKPKPNNNQTITKGKPNANVNDNVNENVLKVNTISNEIDLPKKNREENFYNELAGYKDEYPREMLRAFYEYWSESRPNGKMRKELEKTWETKKRLARWAANQKIKSGHYANPKSEHGNNAGAINLRAFLAQVAGSDFAGT
jgi:hypothetical protein